MRGMDKRIFWTGAAITLVALLIVARLFVLMVLEHDAYALLASKSQDVSSNLFPVRGSVFIQDTRIGEEYPLAINKDIFLVYADTRKIENQETAQKVAQELARVLNYDDEKKLAVFLQLDKRTDPYEPIDQKVDEEKVNELKNLKLAGILFERRSERVYPEEKLGSSIIGFLGKNDAGLSVGRYGIEGYWQEELAGSGGFFSGAQSRAGNLISLANTLFKPPVNGADILLTIDRTLQFKACERLKKGMEDYKAKTASLIIMDPLTGAVRAMCSLPDYDPNKYNEVESVEVYNNSAIFNAYEPGSVYKPITMAAALNEGVIKPETTFYDSGSVNPGCKKAIENAGFKKYETQSMIGVLENSINTGMVFVVEKLGKAKLKKYSFDFGFGVKGGVGLDGETTGTLDSLSKNEKSEFDCYTATASFGQGVTVTPLQMATAYSVIANGGMLLKPYIVQEMRYSDGRVERTKVKEIRRVIEQRTATLLTGMLVNVVDNGQAKGARVNGYHVAGKTGTAQIAGQGGYTEDYNHSFVGFAPIEDPKFVMVIRFEKPDVKYSADTAAPVFSDIAKFALQYYQVPPTR